MNQHSTRPSGALAAAAAAILAGVAVTSGQSAASPTPAFHPFTATFTSPTWGVALGGSGCAAEKACSAQLRVTADGGRHWRTMPAPSVLVEEGAPGRPVVRQVLFANSKVGWLYGQGGAWFTTDAGARWQRLRLGGTPLAMAASANAAYAVVKPATDARARLLTSPVGHAAWASAGGITANYTALTVHGSAAWLAGTSNLWATTDGRHWHRYGLRCPSQQGVPYYPAGLAATSGSRLAVLCVGNGAMGHEGKEVLLSADGGKTMRLGGQPPSEGIAGLIAVTPGHPDWITITAEISLDRSTDGGRTWTELGYTPQGEQWNCLGYASKSMGWAGYGSPLKGSLLVTGDAGRTWHWVLR